MLQSTLSAVLLFTLIGALFLMIRLWWKKSWFFQWVRGMAGFAAFAIVILAVLAVFDVWSYHNVLAEKPIASVLTTQLDDQHYRVTVRSATNHEQTIELYGDQWQLDVRLLTWSGPIAALGVSPLYRLERLSGRYVDIQQERTGARSVYSLSDGAPLDIWSWVGKLQKVGAIWLNAKYGSAVYLPLVDGGEYTVYLTARGVEAKPSNESAKDAVNQW